MVDEWQRRYIHKALKISSVENYLTRLGHLCGRFINYTATHSFYNGYMTTLCQLQLNCYPIDFSPPIDLINYLKCDLYNKNAFLFRCSVNWISIEFNIKLVGLPGCCPMSNNKKYPERLTPRLDSEGNLFLNISARQIIQCKGDLTE